MLVETYLSCWDDTDVNGMMCVLMELGTVREDATGGEEGIIDDGVGHCKRGRYGRGRRHNR